MRKVLLIDTVHPYIPEELEKHGFVCDSFPHFGRRELLEIAPNYVGFIIRSKIKLDREFLAKATKAKFIGRVGAGMENIDVAYANQHGILCVNSPEGNRDAVGEHALGMLLALFNHLTKADREVRMGSWLREDNRGLEVKGKTIGIIGYGNMGSAFAQRLQGFQANVISYDKYKAGYADAYTSEVDLETLFREADVISLHVPLTEETRYMVDLAFFDRCRKPVFLINTARGSVVKTSDLVTALESNKVLGAALDVLEYEEGSFETLKNDHNPDFAYLCGSDKVLLTPHIAGWTVESNFKLAKFLVDKIVGAFP